MSLLVVEPGLQTLIVDAGRPTTRHWGVPLGGAADRMSWMLANLLVGNSPDAAALEICLAGPTLEVQSDVGVALVGAPFEWFRNDVRLSPNRAIQCRPGDRLRIGGTARSSRAYLAIAGGIQNPMVLGSQTSFDRLERGRQLNCRNGTVDEQAIQYAISESDGPVFLRALPGAQVHWFDQEQFFGPRFAVTPTSNRMGIRLQGEPLKRPERELVSEPVAPGAVQVVNDGQCIVLGVDGQTIGGYPKVAHVIGADLDRLGQLRPGDSVVFELLCMDEAEAAWRERQQALQAWVARLTV
jgi:antagonist of KipI